MSKELEALERLTTFIGVYNEEQAQAVCKDIELIEKALKDYEELKDRLCITDVVKEDIVQLWKEHNALDIIKEKIVLIDVFIESKSAKDYNEFVSKSKERHLTKKEYDLLKEIFV